MALFALFSASISFAQEIEIPKPAKDQWYNTRNAFKDCVFKGQKMDCVKVKIRPEYENVDFKVRIVDNNEDLTVKILTYNSWSSCRCGQWWFVKPNESADFTVKFVEYGEDFTIRISEKD